MVYYAQIHPPYKQTTEFLVYSLRTILTSWLQWPNFVCKCSWNGIYFEQHLVTCGSSRNIIYYILYFSFAWLVNLGIYMYIYQLSAVTQSCLTLCNPKDWNMLGFLSITKFWSLLKLMSIPLVMPSNNLICCHPLHIPTSIFPSTGGLFQWVHSSH